MSGKRLISPILIAVLLILVVGSLLTNAGTVSAEPSAPTDGTLTVIKVLTNDNGGTLSEENFQFSLNGGIPISFEPDGQNDIPVTAGTYTVVETSVAGYDTTYDNCTDIVIAEGGSQTCTITNNDIQATLTVIKQVVNDSGGSALPSAFSINVAGPGASPSNFNGAASPGTTVTLNPGSYTVTEVPAPGYSTTYSPNCVSTIALGESKTCTITNNDIQATLTVIKQVVIDSGGSALPSAFSINVAGPGASPSNFNGAASPGTTVTLNPGSYTVTEDPSPGYSTTYSPNCVSTLALGENKTCTITNDDIGATLTLVKSMSNNNGGTAITSDFQAYIDGSPVPWSLAQPVTPGLHTASESTLLGYSASTWGFDCAIDGTITIALGENKTCTITNDDIQPSLTVIKQVINDDGRTSIASDFIINISGTNVSLPSFPGAVSPGITVTLDAGLYDVTETAVTGYTASYSADCSGTIVVGELRTCTITNNDSPPVVNLTPEFVSQGEDVSPLVVRAQLDAISSSDITVPFSISSSSTATQTNDYTINPSPLIIPAGFLDANITITVVDDIIYENDETIILTMGTPTNAARGLITSATATIVDDEQLIGLSDFYEIRHSRTLNIPKTGFPGLLNNDPIGSNVSLSLEVPGVNEPTHGTLEYINNDGSFRYIPVPGYVGPDTFEYIITNTANNEKSAPIPVTINVFDPTSPHVAWELPVENGEQYEVRCEDITLDVDASDDISIDHVVLSYFDWVTQKEMEIEILTEQPYRTTFSTCVLNPEFNQINAIAYDNSGNDSGYPAFIWLYRYAYTVFLPTLKK